MSEDFEKKRKALNDRLTDLTAMINSYEQALKEVRALFNTVQDELYEFQRIKGRIDDLTDEE